MEPSKAANQEVTVVLWGRTGAGKSALGNKLANQKNLFAEGHTLTSQTDNTTPQVFNFYGIKMKLIDTPGFGDNRTNVSNTQLMANCLRELKKLEGGFNLGIFCIPGNKTRIDSHDINEIQMLGTLLGHSVFAHTIIALTQMDTLTPEKQKEAYLTLPSQIPPILKEHGFDNFSQDRILFSNFSKFEQEFALPLKAQIMFSDNYIPEISKEIDLQRPETLAKFMQTPMVQNLLKKQEESLKKKSQELVEQNELVREMGEKNKIIKSQMEAREKEIGELKERTNEIREMRQNNKELMQTLITLANRPPVEHKPLPLPMCNIF